MSRRYTWQQRIERADYLHTEHQSAADILRFYATLARFQKQLFEEFAKTGEAEIASLAVRGPELVSVVQRDAPPTLAALAGELKDADWKAILSDYWTALLEGASPPPNFFAQALLQPYAESLAWEPPESAAEKCPFCNSPPQLGVLHPEGEGGKRYLFCGMCGSEWVYRRIICPRCGETDKEKLPVFKSERYPQAQITACDSCRSYLKCIDRTVDGHAIPAVDDLATVSLSLWALGEHYLPVLPNLFGF